MGWSNIKFVVAYNLSNIIRQFENSIYSVMFTKFLTCCNKQKEDNDKGIAKVEKVGEGPSNGGPFNQNIDREEEGVES